MNGEAEAAVFDGLDLSAYHLCVGPSFAAPLSCFPQCFRKLCHSFFSWLINRLVLVLVFVFAMTCMMMQTFCSLAASCQLLTKYVVIILSCEF